MNELNSGHLSGHQSEHQVRADLAAAFRWAARLDLHEAVANHFSGAVSADGSRFVMNPKGRHFSRMRCSELVLLDAGEAGRADVPDAAIPRRGSCTAISTGRCRGPGSSCTRTCRTPPR